MNGTPLLRIEDLRVSFHTAHGPVLALNGVSLSLHDDEVLAVVGESGSGKTLTGLSVLGLEPPDAMVTGRVWFRDEELRAAPPRRLRDIRGASIAMIFQEPMTSLNPSLTVGRQVPDAGAVRPGPAAIRGAAPAVLPPPAVGRHATAGHDRHGRRLRPRRTGRRRADHRARPDDPGADPQPA